jgi:hypothetical protein
VTADTSKEPKPRGKGVGQLARMLLMDPSGYPHALIAMMVNQQIEGATATDKSVRWYAAKIREDGVGTCRLGPRPSPGIWTPPSQRSTLRPCRW